MPNHSRRPYPAHSSERDPDDWREDWTKAKRTTGVVLRHPFVALFVALLVASLALLVTMSRGAQYRSTLVLKLDDEQQRNPILDGLAIPTGTTEVDEAIAFLRSAELLREICKGPADGSLAHPDHPDYGRHMGLSTLVEEEGLGTLKHYIDRLQQPRSSSFRVFADLEPMQNGAPRAVLAKFIGDGQVELRVPNDEESHSWPAGIVERVPFVPGETIELRGLKLRLATQGAQDGRTLRIRRRPRDEAALWIYHRLEVVAMPDEAGTVLISFEDSDPRRAAEVAGAIADNFLESDTHRTQKRAAEIVDYIGEELEERRDELGRVNTSISRILERYPDAIDLNNGFLRLSETRGLIESRHLEVSGLRRAFEELGTQLLEGNRAMASRLGEQLDDPMTRRYLDSIAALTNELVRVNGDKPGTYLNTLQSKQADAQQALYEAQRKLVSIEQLIHALRSGDMAALGRLGTPSVEGDTSSVDEITLSYGLEFAKTQGEIAALEIEFKADYPILITKRRHRDALLDLILAQLEARRRAMELDAEGFADLLRSWDTLLTERGANEAVDILAALEELWTLVSKSVGARSEGLRQEEAHLRSELDTLELKIADLPEAQRLLSEPQVEREALEGVVSLLTEKKELAAVAAAGAVSSGQILSPALVPRRPISPSLALGLAIGLVFGSFAAFATSLLYDNLFGRLRSVRDFEELAKAPILGTLAGSRGIDSFSGAFEKSAAGLRTLRAQLQQLERDAGKVSTLGVTCTRRGEGQTAVSAGLAAAYALQGRRVLLIDANLREPALDEHCGTPLQPGLTESLEGEAHWQDVVAETSISGLDLLPAGDACESPADLLSGTWMERLLAEAGKSYDLTLVDLPPSEDLPDVACIGPLLDGVLLVSSTRRPPARRHLSRILDRLAACGVTVLGIVRQKRTFPLSGQSDADEHDEFGESEEHRLAA